MAAPVEPSNADGGLLVFERIVQLLDAAAVGYRSLEHPPTLTSEDSARVRQEPLEVGAKALLLKAAEHYLIVVIPADRKLDSAALKRQLAMKSLRFASADELMQLTGLLPGALPPFGQPIFPFPLYADPSVGAKFGRVAFNAGCRSRSVVMAQADWLRLAKPIQIEVCQ